MLKFRNQPAEQRPGTVIGPYKVLQMIGGGAMPKLPKGARLPPQMAANMPRQAAAAGHGKKRKKGGPWGLIKTR